MQRSSQGSILPTQDFLLLLQTKRCHVKGACLLATDSRRALLGAGPPLFAQPGFNPNEVQVPIHSFVVFPFTHDGCRVRGGNIERGLPVSRVVAGGVEETQQLVRRMWTSNLPHMQL